MRTQAAPYLRAIKVVRGHKRARNAQQVLNGEASSEAMDYPGGNQKSMHTEPYSPWGYLSRKYLKIRNHYRSPM